jgi:hypothetical protein
MRRKGRGRREEGNITSTADTIAMSKTAVHTIWGPPSPFMASSARCRVFLIIQFHNANFAWRQDSVGIKNDNEK